jgi:hypothetical protein
MADDDSDTGSEDQQPAGDGEDSKPESKEEDGKSDGKGKDDKKTDDKKSDDKKTDDKKSDDKKTDGKKDEEQERKDLFAKADGDPLAEALGSASAQAGRGQAYRTWMRTVHAPGAGAFISGGSIGVLNITQAAGAYDRQGQAPGPVRTDIIDELSSRYAPVDGYETFVRQLTSTRLLVLRGAPGTGRTTTGLRLLAKLTDNVARFSPDIDLRALTTADLDPESGYLLELNPGSASLPPTPAHVDRLRGYLAECECYLVVVAPHDIRYRDSFDGYIADCPLPDPQQVFDQIVGYEIGRQPDKEQILQQIAICARPSGSTGPQTPSEVRWLVAHLMSTATANYASAELELLHSDLVGRYVSAWFEPLAGLPATSEGDESVRLAAFRIALAVLNENPFDLVAEAAENLTERILIARSPRRKPGRPVFARHREDYVANSRASIKPGSVRISNAYAPASLVTYDDDRLPVAVLRHVWAVHNLRDPLLSWLESLGNDFRPEMHMRAALAIGLLSSWDFSYTFHKRIEPWAKSEDSRSRWIAAVALDEASRNDEVRPVVREILEEWCDEEDFALRWTSAMALGYGLGLRDPAKALKELRKLGCWKDGQLATEATWAVARIFVLGSIKPVIKTLAAWLNDDRRDVRRLGLVVVRRIAHTKVGELEDQFELTDTSAGGRWTQLASRRRWPLLVALADEDPDLLDPLADLVWQLTRSSFLEKATAKILKRWMRAGAKDRTCLGPVGRFLALLGDDHSDRVRLLHLVRALRQDPDEPLPADVADRLARAIEHNIHIGDEKGVSDDESSAQAALAAGA